MLQGYIPPPFPLQSSLNGTEYSGRQNSLTENVLSTFVSDIRFLIPDGFDRKLNDLYFLVLSCPELTLRLLLLLQLYLRLKIHELDSSVFI